MCSKFLQAQWLHSGFWGICCIFCYHILLILNFGTSFSFSFYFFKEICYILQEDFYLGDVLWRVIHMLQFEMYLFYSMFYSKSLCFVQFIIISYFGPQVYPRGSLVITLVCGPSVRWSLFKYLRDRSLFFSNFLHEVRAP